ncbi:hypothetical protein BJX99DRAFT_254052 [Aspergillus californicus]
MVIITNHPQGPLLFPNPISSSLMLSDASLLTSTLSLLPSVSHVVKAGMMNLFARGLASPLAKKERRQLTNPVEELILPGQCYDDCNTAGLESNLTPETCVSFYDNCVSCAERFANSDDPDSGQSAVVIPGLSPVSVYCANETNSTNTVDLNSLLSSWSSLLETQSALQESLGSLGYNPSSFATMTMTTDDGVGTVSPPPTTSAPSTASATDSASQNDSTSNSPGSPNVKVIVPAVVVPIVVLLVVVAVVAWALMRRRQKRQTAMGAASGEDHEGKAQLHGDGFRPELDANATTKKKTTLSALNSHAIAELPAREPVGGEMDASERGT